MVPVLRRGGRALALSSSRPSSPDAPEAPGSTGGAGSPGAEVTRAYVYRACTASVHTKIEHRHGTSVQCEMTGVENVNLSVRQMRSPHWSEALSVLHVEGSWRHSAYTFNWSRIGKRRILLPVAAKIALHNAGGIGGTPGSPTPPIGLL